LVIKIVGCGGARSYVRTVAQANNTKLTMATASRIHFRTSLTLSGAEIEEAFDGRVTLLIRSLACLRLQCRFLAFVREASQ
jgi:hypothetical protein